LEIQSEDIALEKLSVTFAAEVRVGWGAYSLVGMTCSGWPPEQR
jgi:hypothetical protein